MNYFNEDKINILNLKQGNVNASIKTLSII